MLWKRSCYYSYPVIGLEITRKLIKFNCVSDDLYYCGLEARVPNYGRQRSSIAICANSALDLRKYFNSSLQLSSLPADLSAHQQNSNYTSNWSDDNNLESLDVFEGRDSVRKKYSAKYHQSINKYTQQKDASHNSRPFLGQWK